MSPEYFHTHLTWQEANDYLAGIQRRYRPSWQQARLIADVDARCAGNKQGLKLEFPWEKEERQRRIQDEITPEWLEQARINGDQWAAELNRKAQS